MYVLSSIIFLRLSVASRECCKLICIHLMCLHYVRSIAVFCVEVTVAPHFNSPCSVYSYKIACRLRHVLSSEEWLSHVFMLVVYKGDLKRNAHVGNIA